MTILTREIEWDVKVKAALQSLSSTSVLMPLISSNNLTKITLYNIFLNKSNNLSIKMSYNIYNRVTIN